VRRHGGDDTPVADRGASTCLARYVDSDRWLHEVGRAEPPPDTNRGSSVDRGHIQCRGKTKHDSKGKCADGEDFGVVNGFRFALDNNTSNPKRSIWLIDWICPAERRPVNSAALLRGE